jgi:hypothetical protein
MFIGYDSVPDSIMKGGIHGAKIGRGKTIAKEYDFAKSGYGKIAKHIGPKNP